MKIRPIVYLFISLCVSLFIFGFLGGDLSKTASNGFQ